MVACRQSAPLRAARSRARTHLARHRADERGLALPRHAAPRDRDPRPLRDPLHVGGARLLHRTRRIHAVGERARSLRHLAHRGTRRADRRRGADRDRDADLQRARSARVRRTAGDVRITRAHRPTRALRLLRAIGHERSRPPRRRDRRLERRVRQRRRLRAHLLPLAPPPHQAQERQHRRFLPALGTPLPLHGDPRCRQRDERHLPYDARAPRRSQPRRRHHPDRAPRHGPRNDVRAHAAVRHAHVRPAVHRRPALLAVGRVALLGSQRDHPHRAVHALLPARETARPGRAVGRDPLARLRGSRAHAPRGVGSVDLLRPAGELRGDAPPISSTS